MLWKNYHCIYKYLIKIKEQLNNNIIKTQGNSTMIGNQDPFSTVVNSKKSSQSISIGLTQ